MIICYSQMIIFNHKSPEKMSRTDNDSNSETRPINVGQIYNNSQTSQSISNIENSNQNSKTLKLLSNFLFIGKVKNSTSYIEIRKDRILFANIHNSNLPNKYNITIPFSEVTALRYSFTNDISIIFIQPIRESYEKLSKWVSRDQPLSRIVPENFVMISLEKSLTKNVLKQMEQNAKDYNPIIKFIEINSAFALDYLNKPNKTYQFKMQPLTSTPIKKANSEAEVIHLDDDEENDNSPDKKDNSSMLNKAILRYPENEAKQIILYGYDLNCLRDGQYLNDNIMNFYLKYYQYNGNITEDVFNKIHIYDALFGSYLLSSNRRRKISLAKKFIFCSHDSLEQAYHSVLKKWTKNIDIFAKDFLLFPLVKDGHWFLIILCYIGNVIVEKSGIVPNKSQAMKKPTIIFMDSLLNSLNRIDIKQSILSYLNLELKEKRGLSIECDPLNFKTLQPKVPQQSNYYDCGLFVLEYIEKFLICPDEIYLKLLNNNNALNSWFDAKTLSTKRAKIQQIILNLLEPEYAKKLEAELTKEQLNNFDNGAEEKFDERPPPSEQKQKEQEKKI